MQKKRKEVEKSLNRTARGFLQVKTFKIENIEPFETSKQIDEITKKNQNPLELPR